MSAREWERGDQLRGKEGRKVSEREEEGEQRARKRLIDFGKRSKTCPQFSDSKTWLTVSVVRLVRQLATRIGRVQRRPKHPTPTPPPFSEWVLKDFPRNLCEG